MPGPRDSKGTALRSKANEFIVNPRGGAQLMTLVTSRISTIVYLKISRPILDQSHNNALLRSSCERASVSR